MEWCTLGWVIAVISTGIVLYGVWKYIKWTKAAGFSSVLTATTVVNELLKPDENNYNNEVSEE